MRNGHSSRSMLLDDIREETDSISIQVISIATRAQRYIPDFVIELSSAMVHAYLIKFAVEMCNDRREPSNPRGKSVPHLSSSGQVVVAHEKDLVSSLQ